MKLKNIAILFIALSAYLNLSAIHAPHAIGKLPAIKQNIAAPANILTPQAPEISTITTRNGNKPNIVNASTRQFANKISLNNLNLPNNRIATNITAGKNKPLAASQINTGPKLSNFGKNKLQNVNKAKIRNFKSNGTNISDNNSKNNKNNIKPKNNPNNSHINGAPKGNNKNPIVKYDAKDNNIEITDLNKIIDLDANPSNMVGIVQYLGLISEQQAEHIGDLIDPQLQNDQVRVQILNQLRTLAQAISHLPDADSETISSSLDRLRIIYESILNSITTPFIESEEDQIFNNDQEFNQIEQLEEESELETDLGQNLQEDQLEQQQQQELQSAAITVNFDPNSQKIDINNNGQIIIIPAQDITSTQNAVNFFANLSEDDLEDVAQSLIQQLSLNPQASNIAIADLENLLQLAGQLQNVDEMVINTAEENIENLIQFITNIADNQ